MRIKYFGRSGFLIEDLLIDPYIRDNPSCRSKVEDIRCRIICVSHSHHDHLGDAFEIAKNNGAVLIATHEIGELASPQGIRSEGMNIGGQITSGDWSIKMVEALHSSEVGHSAGFILKNLRLDRTIYHAGDTGLFSDMRLVGEEGIDIAMLPIGGRYTMGMKDALKAVDMVRPKIVIPMHYDTSAALRASPEEFKNECPAEVEIFQFDEEKDLGFKSEERASDGI